jgi:glycosyltransferase involved in cell wall biosynthesis
LAKALQREGVEISILSLGYPFDNQAYTWHGIPVQSCYGKNGSHFRWINWWRMHRYAQKLHSKSPFDVIQIFWLGPCWLVGRHLARKWRIPHWTTLMGQDVLPENRYRFLLKPQHFPNLIALTHFQNQIFEKNNHLKAGQVIPFGIDPLEIPNQLSDNRPIDILGCGSFISLKNWPLWLQTVDFCKKSNPHIKAVLIGDGTQRTEIEQLAQQLGLEDTVTFTGHIPRTEVFQYMQQSKVFLHTANFESLGYVLEEARMLGCLLVSTPVGIAPEIAACASTENELSALVLKLLARPLREVEANSWTIQDTAKGYFDLYSTNIKLNSV